MNKKLLAIAIAGVLAAPLAQAQTANVTLYGRINIDAEVIINAKSGSPTGLATAGISVIGCPPIGAQVNSCLPGEPPAGTKQNLYRVSSNSSRLGVRGTESLGGGLNAIFQIESNVSADSSGGQFATRETFAGLQGGWGTLKLGYFLTPYDDIQGIFGSVPTLMTGILGSQGLWANGGASVEAGGFDARVGNSVRYDSPNIAGFTGSVQLGARDGNSTNPVPALTGANAPDSPTPGDPRPRRAARCRRCAVTRTSCRPAGSTTTARSRPASRTKCTTTCASARTPIRSCRIRRAPLPRRGTSASSRSAGRTSRSSTTSAPAAT